MTDELDRRLAERVEAATPDAPAPFIDVLVSRARRRTRRRSVGVVAAIVAVGAVVTGVALADQPSGPDRGADVATESPSASAAPLVIPPVVPGGPPPAIVVAGTGPQLDTWQGSYCWGNSCADSISPPLSDLPDLGAAPTVRAGFAEPAAWTVSLAGTARCASYPVLLTPSADGTYELTPSGPAGDYRTEVFLYPARGGDASGLFRWTTPGATEPAAWAHLHQNGPNEGGGGVVQVVLDGAAVDGQVTGEATVSGAGGTRTLALGSVEQGCPGDRFVRLGTGYHADRAVDGLGDGPFTYDVDVVVDGVHHRATATSADGAEDTPLTFTPALPQ